MLVNCPKCGFSQPKDTYCAKCGIEMATFRGAPPPLTTRLFSNPMVPITAISFLVVAGTLYILKEQRARELTRRIQYLRSGPVYQSAQPVVADTQGSEESTETISAPANLPVPEVAGEPVAEGTPAMTESAGETPVPPPVPAPERGAVTLASSTADVSTAKPAAAYQIKAHYLLLGRGLWGRVLTEMQAQPGFIDFGEFKVGLLKSNPMAAQGADLLQTVTKTYAPQDPELIWFVGTRTAEHEIGLTSRIHLERRENGGFSGEIEVMKSFFENRERGSVPSVRSLGPVGFELPAKAFLGLIMTPPTVPQLEQDQSATGFMRLFRMTDFLQKQSEFLMILELE